MFHIVLPHVLLSLLLAYPDYVLFDVPMCVFIRTTAASYSGRYALVLFRTPPVEGGHFFRLRSRRLCFCPTFVCRGRELDKRIVKLVYTSDASLSCDALL